MISQFHSQVYNQEFGNGSVSAHGSLYINVYSSVIHNKRWNNPSVPQQINGQVVVYIEKNISDTQKYTEMHAITWLNLKNTVLSESQTSGSYVAAALP